MEKKSLLLIMVALVFLETSSVQAYDFLIEEVINNPTVTYKKNFGVDVPLETWNKILDNLYLMGQLWEINKFQPSYKVTKVDSGLHIDDPTGIVGDIWQVGQSENARTFHGVGKFDHWAVPSFFTANGVFFFEYRMDQKRLLGEMKISLRGNNSVSRLVMKIFSGVLINHVDNRFKNNLEDMKKIIKDIVNDPDKVRKILTGRLLDDFNEVFPVEGIRLTEGLKKYSQGISGIANNIYLSAYGYL
jgi:hypothetical protein